MSWRDPWREKALLSVFSESVARERERERELKRREVGKVKM